MTKPLVTTASSAVAASSSTSTVTTDLFAIPTGACRLAIQIAGLGPEDDSPSANETNSDVFAKPVSNPDIAGIGILIAFLATAYGIFIWMLIAYVCRYLPSSLLGHVDVFIFKRPARERTSPPWWQNAVDQSILAYADLQIATGVGILTAAFATMDSLSVYHLQVAIYLAWMSSNTHLTAISLLQTEFRENRNKSIARRLRLGGMALLGVMLVVALVPTTAHNWLAIITRSIGSGRNVGTLHQTALSSAGMPARCFWHSRYSGGLTPDAAWSFIILIFSYFWKALLLFKSSHRYLKVSVRRKMQGPLQRLLDSIAARLRQNRQDPSIWLIFQYKATFALYLAVWALFELAQSFVMSLWVCGAGLVWGSFQILEPRRILPSQTLDAENSWTFGQILPILLLAVPILAFAEGYTVQKAELSHKRRFNEPLMTGLPPADEESLRTRSEPFPTSNTDTKPEASREPRRVTISKPWRCDERIYESRFVQFSFWGSQLGILSLAALFIVFYFELFVDLSVPGQSKLGSTLMTDYGIWFIVGCTVLGWLGMAVFLLMGGAMFSSLFGMNHRYLTEEDL